MGNRVLKEMYTLIENDIFKMFEAHGSLGGALHENLPAIMRERIETSEKIIKYDKEGKIKGYVTYYDFGEWIEMLNLCVRNDLRKTLGAKLGKQLVFEVVKLGKPIKATFLKVEDRIINYAVRLGFEFTGSNEFQVFMRREAKK